MTDTEIKRAIAEKVMGWEYWTGGEHNGDAYCLGIHTHVTIGCCGNPTESGECCGNGCPDYYPEPHLVPVEAFNPTESFDSLKPVWDVLTDKEKLAVGMELTCSSMSYPCLMFDYAPREICLAILKVKEVEA